MKLSLASTALIATLLTATSAAPSNLDQATSQGLTKRQTTEISNIISLIENHKRDLSLTPEELAKRDYPIVTEILEAINSSGLAPGIIQYIIDDPTLSADATIVILKVIKSGYFNLTTLLKGLNDSGLAIQVIQDVISNCQFYAEVYKIVLQNIGNIGDIINKILGGNTPKRDLDEIKYLESNAKRTLDQANINRSVSNIKRDQAQDIITNLMESLKLSGLVDTVVNTLVVDDHFYYWGADLLTQIIKSGAISYDDLFSSMLQSGLIFTLFDYFTNIDTLKTVIANALAAAAGKCDAATLTTLSATTTVSASGMSQVTATTPPPTGTFVPSAIPIATGTGSCKKRRRRAY